MDGPIFYLVGLYVSSVSLGSCFFSQYGGFRKRRKKEEKKEKEKKEEGNIESQSEGAESTFCVHGVLSLNKCICSPTTEACVWATCAVALVETT